MRLSRKRVALLAYAAFTFLLFAWLAFDQTRTTNNPPVQAATTQIKRDVTATSNVAPKLSSIKQTLVRESLGLSIRDPFFVMVPPPPKSANTPILSQIPSAQIVTTIVAPSVTAVDLRFAGRITGPDGNQTIYASAGDKAFSLAVGLVLPSGYRVESISDSEVELIHPQSNKVVKFDLPELPKFETR